MATDVLAVPILDDVEVLDFCGPFEVFSVASRFTDPPAFSVVLVAERDGSVLTRGGMSVNAHHRLADCPRPDILPAPGGQGTRKEMQNPALVGWVGRAAAQAELVLSVCTGALVMAAAGHRATAATLPPSPHPRHDRHKELLKWRGPFDPQALDAKLTTDEMRKLK